MVQTTQLVVIGTVAVLMGWSPEISGIGSALFFILLGATAFTALGLLIAGTVRPEASLAITNISWVVLGTLRGVVYPLAECTSCVICDFLSSGDSCNGL